MSNLPYSSRLPPLRGGRKPDDPPAPETVIGILTGDVHWSHRPPVFRSNEPDWYAAMERAWEQVNALSEKYQCPILVAGDLFHGWREPHQLITWAMKMLRRPTYAVPGNHDLPGHMYSEMHRSAYGVLVEAGKLVTIDPERPLVLPGLVIHGFPCGYPVTPWTGGSVSPFGIRLALVHDYIWTADKGYPGAPVGLTLGSWEARLEGYDVAAFGDNHNGFLGDRRRTGKADLINCGCLMRRRADERDYKPAVGLLYADGRIDCRYLDISEDKYLTPEELVTKAEEIVTDFTDFVEGLERLGATALDFAEAVRQSLTSDPPPGEAGKVILEILDRVTEGK